MAAMRPWQQFIVYRVVPSTRRPGKTDKLPLHPETFQIHDAHDPAIWLPVEAAAAIAETLGPNHGVGFVFTENDPFWFLDIDSCAEGNEWAPHAQALMQRFAGCAVEVSASGVGLHLFGCGTCPPHKTRYAHWFEFYTSGRFAALTGNCGPSGDIWTDHTPALTQLVADYLTRDPNDRQGEWTETPDPRWRGNTNDDELIARMLRSDGGAAATLGYRPKFHHLWENDEAELAKFWPDTGGKGRAYDATRADAALAQALAFWTGNDCARIERLMRRSALAREKWDDHSTYMYLTITNAVGRQHDVLIDKEPEPVAGAVAVASTAPTPQLVTGSTFLTIEQQVAHFAGCVFIESQNRALIPGGIILKPEAFRVKYGGYSYTMDLTNEHTTRDAWEAFTQNSALRRPIAYGLCFKPTLPPGHLIEDGGLKMTNLWWPIETPTVQGDPAPFTNHLQKLFPNERDREIITSYMAAIVQYPGVKFQWAPLIQGVEGNGKTLIVSAIGEAVGKRYRHLPNINDLTETGAKFTGWLQGKLFLGFEEVRTDDKRNMLEVLKQIITNSYLEIQSKGVDQITGDNCANIIACSNHKDAVPKLKNDRRWAIFYTAQQEEADLARDGLDGDYMPRLWRWMLSDGYAIVTNYLKTYPIKDELNPATSLHRAPLTSSTAEAMRLSDGYIEQEIAELIEQGTTGFAGGWISSHYLDLLLKRHRADRMIPPRKRRELLRSLGYDWHPALRDMEGRSPIVVKPDGVKPRLFCKIGHVAANFSDPRQAAKQYEKAQNDITLEAAKFGTGT
jgi:hypothetical protein